MWEPTHVDWIDRRRCGSQSRRLDVGADTRRLDVGAEHVDWIDRRLEDEWGTDCERWCFGANRRWPDRWRNRRSRGWHSPATWIRSTPGSVPQTTQMDPETFGADLATPDPGLHRWFGSQSSAKPKWFIYELQTPVQSKLSPMTRIQPVTDIRGHSLRAMGRPGGYHGAVI